MSHNQLTTFPLSLLNLKHLAIVDLSSNRLTSVPGEVGKLEATELVLNCNQISHLASEISKCPRLKTLRMEENCLALDSIPKALLAERFLLILGQDTYLLLFRFSVEFLCLHWRETCLMSRSLMRLKVLTSTWRGTRQ